MPINSDLRAPSQACYMTETTKNQEPKPLDDVRQGLRLHHYFFDTERSYVNWIAWFILFTGSDSLEPR